MKTITIGDLHGESVWKTIDPEKYDKIIFIGDYVDSFYVSDTLIKRNLLDIIEFRKKYANKVILLWGNHDVQYLFSYTDYGCTGYRSSMYIVLNQIFNENRHLFLPIFVIRTLEFEYIWTHAGIHKGWYNQDFLPTIKNYGLKDAKIEIQVQQAFDRKIYSIFQVGHLRGGYENTGGIMWLDKRLLLDKPLNDVHQIAGHSKVPKIQTVDYDFLTSVTLVDCLDETNTFYELEIY